jgi:hypothetical protein
MARYALLIGNSIYDSLPNLGTPPKDVEDLAKLLEDPKIGNFDDVKQLINSTKTATKKLSKIFSDAQKMMSYYYFLLTWFS